MAKHKKSKNWLIIVGVIVVMIVVYLYVQNKEEDKGDKIFSYNGFHKYTSNQFAPKDACYDLFYDFRDNDNTIPDDIDVVCTGTATGDLKVGGNLQCTCKY